MERALTQFVGLLRKTGVQVSQAELLDASEAVCRMDLGERCAFKDALRATLIKRTKDIPVFDALFDNHFSTGSPTGSAPERSEREAIAELTAFLNEMPAYHAPEISRATELILSGRFGEILRLALTGSQSLGLQQMAAAPLRGSFFLHRLRQELGLDRVADELEDLIRRKRDQGVDSERLRIVREYVLRSLGRIDEQLAAMVRQEVSAARLLMMRRIDEEDAVTRDLAFLSDEEVLSMRPVVERLARRLKDRLSMRLKREEAGRLDLKTTLRKNVGLGGPLPYLHFRHKKLSKPLVVALCDVSRSVRNFSRFMLLFLYTLKEVIPSVKSYVFVGDLVEVTTLFQGHEINKAISMAAQGHGLKYPFGTDYGTSFTQFAQEHLSAVNSRTTVVILGDARNNNLPPRLDSLGAIAERARRVIWLNPESRLTWKLGDSVMDLYQPFCAVVEECGNLGQLTRLIEEALFPQPVRRWQG
ncbi:MAG: VWA domain-containing protein [Deltaproteobacteria bacterium]|nr:VWA domain-containing protein [Deltaproteobacteria bacterium]